MSGAHRSRAGTPRHKQASVAADVQSFAVLGLIDSVAWAVAITAALVLRFDFEFHHIKIKPTLVLIALTALLQLGIGWLTWLYRKRWAIGSCDEVRALVIDITVVMALAWVFAYFYGYGNGIPRSTMIIAAPIAFSLMGVSRYLVRLYQEQKQIPGTGAARTLIYGAGYAGGVTARRLRTDPHAAYLPVGFLDDAPEKRNVDVRGVRVLGTLDDLADVAEQTDATKLIVCIGDADSALLRRVHERAEEAGVQVMVMPALDSILSGRSAFEDVRAISIEDLIGRTPVRLDTTTIRNYVQGHRVLVTGAGGSIGSELCRQLSHFMPSELMLLDRDETSLQATQLSVSGNGLLDSNEVVLADIRDPHALNRIFLARKPEVVFHAAALKHLPMLEQYPDEAWKTNVLGTLNVLQAAQAAQVETFINISTDKAANPTSVLGHSKRVAEKLTAWMARETGKRYLSVRFGNVIGSRGSMLPTFRKLIEDGGPLTVTHPDVTRFFMTIPEACQLVMQAGAIGRPGEVLILDMGEPVRILDIAQRMIAQSGKDIEIVFTGLRHGEKLHEELVGRGEGNERPFHPKISHAHVDWLSPEGLDYGGWVTRLDLTDRAQQYVEFETKSPTFNEEFAPTAPITLPSFVREEPAAKAEPEQ